MLEMYNTYTRDVYNSRLRQMEQACADPNDNENEEEDKKLGLMTMDSDDEKDHFDFKHIVEAENQEGKSRKKKWKKKKKELDVPVDDNFSVNVEDNRFSAMFSRPDYNIDPTNPSFKKTKISSRNYIKKR